MSKMPAKKKSCFQITSVTQAQVAASNATDDTESLDDPDESRTEDVSSEIFDMSRADYEPEVCNRSSSEETLNNVGESELLYIQSGQIPTLPGPPDGGFTVRPVGSTSFTVINQQGNGSGQFSGTQRQLPVPAGTGVPTTVHASTSLPAVAGSITSTNTTPTSCSSRFRVIKLDHGTGEPFRRGRWTCTEFYEKDPEGSVTSRTVDSIRHPNASEVGPDRDSGLGTTVGSTAAQSGLSGQGADAIVETAQLSTTLLETQQQQQQQQAVQGLAAYDAFSNKPGAAPALAQGQGGAHTAALPSLTPPGAPHQDVHIQKTPGMPPTPQTPPLAYPAQPPPPQSQPHGLQMQNQPALIPASQAEYSQQHLPITVAQTLPSAGVSTQGLSSGLAPAPGGAQVLGVAGDMMVVSMSGVPLPGSQPVTSPAPSLVQQQAGGAMVGSVASAPPGGTGQQLQQPPVSQYNPPGVIHGVSMALQGAQALPSAVLAGASGGGVLMPNASPTMLGQSAQVPRNGMVAGSAASPGVGFIPPDEGQRQADALPLVPAISGKDMANPLIPDALHLASPAVNSLFGISIPIDGDDDSASGASVVAIDNKIEQAMDLVKSHLMYAVREEVEVLKEQIKELYERNSVLERENAVLKSLANSEQLSQLSVQPPSNSGGTPPPSGLSKSPAPVTQTQIPPALEVPHAMASPPAPQPNVTSA